MKRPPPEPTKPVYIPIGIGFTPREMLWLAVVWGACAGAVIGTWLAMVVR